MITDDDVVFLVQRGAVVALGLESEEESAKHTREQIEAIVARELAEKTAQVERLREALKSIDKMAYCHKGTIRDMQRCAREALAATAT